MRLARQLGRNKDGAKCVLFCILLALQHVAKACIRSLLEGYHEMEDIPKSFSSVQMFQNMLATQNLAQCRIPSGVKSASHRRGGQKGGALELTRNC